MSAAGTIGALAGLALAAAFFVFSRALAARVELEETRRALRVSSLVQFAILPGLGYLAAWLFVGD